MKKMFLNKVMKIIRKDINPSKEKLEEIMYGMESIYLTITKMIIVTILSIILGIFKEVFLLMICYNVIRVTAFGLHASRSMYCLISSLVMFIGGVYLIKCISLHIVFKIIFSIATIICIIKYAPADTEKRPIINIKKRKKYKMISFTSAVIYFILIIIFHNNFISDYLLLGIIEASIMVHPLVYKIFNLKYDNYKDYTMV